MARSYGLGLVCFALVAAAASAAQFRVGGQRGWSVPDASAEPYNAWAGRMRFHIGDQLLFVYPKETDSVLLVEQAAYNACNTTSYANKFDDGSTVFTLNRSGPFFFISGNEASCRANEKLIVIVLSAAVSPSPSSMPPPSAAPMPPPSGAPMPSPSSSPPSAAPMPAPAATPGSAPSPMASAPSPMASAPGPAPTATPGSPPSPMASAPGPAPTATPGSPPSPEALAPSPSSSPGTPGGMPQPPSASTSPPGAGGSSSTTPGSGAATMAAGLTSVLAAFIGYAMLAI